METEKTSKGHKERKPSDIVAVIKSDFGTEKEITREELNKMNESEINNIDKVIVDFVDCPKCGFSFAEEHPITKDVHCPKCEHIL